MAAWEDAPVVDKPAWEEAPAVESQSTATGTSAPQDGVLHTLGQYASGFDEGAIANILGAPVDTAENLLNIGKAGVGRAMGAMGAKPENLPEVSTGSVGGSDWFKQKLREFGITAQPDEAHSLGRGIAELAGGMMVPGGKKSTREINPDVLKLTKEGVQLTPGQIMGGTVQRAEDAATSLPFMGDAIRSAQRRGIESFNSAALNRALEPIGEKLPKDVPIGNQAVQYVREKLGEAYDTLLPKLKGVVDNQLQQDIDGVRQLGQNLPKEQRTQLESIIKNEVEDQFTGHGLASGETLKNVQSELGRISKDMGQSDNYHQRQLGKAVQEIDASVKRMINRVNPQYKAELDKIDLGYANFKKVQNAAARIGAKEGVFSPSQLKGAVRQGDKSKDKRAYSEGTALMQDLATTGESRMSRTVPDSGTPLRAIVNALMLGEFGRLAPGLGLGAIGGAIPYSRVGQRVLQRYLTRPESGTANVAAKGAFSAEQQGLGLGNE